MIKVALIGLVAVALGGCSLTSKQRAYVAAHPQEAMQWYSATQIDKRDKDPSYRPGGENNPHYKF